MTINEFKQQYYYIRNFYTLGSFIETKSLKYRSNDKELLNYLRSDFEYIGKSNKENTEESKEFLITLIKEEKKNNRFDEYHLDINFKWEITIKYTTKRSLIYAIDVLNNLVDKTNDFKLPICHIDDFSNFEYRGIIEGFYGTVWTHENHLDMLEYMKKHRLNTYMYAPKMDDYHRKKWDVLYPLDYIEKFKELLDKSRKDDIDFYYTISPGFHEKDELGFNFTSDEDYQKLFNKLDQLINIGVNKFGLLLDDIDYVLQGPNKEMFKTPGLAHAAFCNKVYEYLNKKIDHLSFVMCPTEYHELNDSLYRKELRENLNKDIYVFYTGDNVCAELITEKVVETVLPQFMHPLMIWENFPVTDFTYGVRQYMAPLENRTSELPLYVKGYMINPMKHYEISKVGMTTCSHYAWNPQKYISSLSFEIALKEISLDFYHFGLPYIMFNLPCTLTYGNIFDEEKMVNENKNYQIKDYYNNVLLSVDKIINLPLPIINELRPWLFHVKKETALANKILDNNVTKEDILLFLEEPLFNGSELIDRLIIKTSLLSADEIQDLIRKRRGNPWYRIYEHKRYGGNLC